MPGGGDDVEPGLPGWTVFVNSNRNQRLDQGEPVGVTDANGDVSFPGLAQNLYLVCEVLDNGMGEPHEGWFNSDPGASTLCDDVFASDGDQGFIDFGNYEKATGAAGSSTTATVTAPTTTAPIPV